MIHTLEFTINNFQGYYDLLEIENKFKSQSNEKQEDKQFKIYTYSYRGLNFKFYHYLIIRDCRITKVNNIFKTITLNKLKVIVNPNKLLNKSSIKENDFKEFKEEFIKAFKEVFPQHYVDLNKLQLSRIDYKYDFYTDYKSLYLRLLSKTSPCKSLKENSTSTTYYSSKSYNINLYDKLEEREVKEQNLNIKDLDKLLRLEIQIKNDRLYYNLKQYGVTQTINNYWSKSDYTYYINYCLKDIIYSGNYYNAYHIKNILKNNNIKENMINKLMDFAKYISINGIKATKEHYHKNTFNNYVKRLNELNINPIQIPKNNKFKVTYLDNPFNFTNENTYLIKDFNIINPKINKNKAS